MVARLPTRRRHWRRQKRADLPCLLLLFPSLPEVRYTTPCKTHKKTQATVCFASLQIRFLLLQVAGRWTMELLVCGRWLKETVRWLAAV